MPLLLPLVPRSLSKIKKSTSRSEKRSDGHARAVDYYEIARNYVVNGKKRAITSKYLLPPADPFCRILNLASSQQHEFDPLLSCGLSSLWGAFSSSPEQQ